MAATTATPRAGDRFRFDYPAAFTTLPDYTAHAGHVVEIVRPLREGEEYDDEGDPMFRVRAADGWEGDAWLSELQPVQE